MCREIEIYPFLVIHEHRVRVDQVLERQQEPVGELLTVSSPCFSKMLADAVECFAIYVPSSCGSSC